MKTIGKKRSTRKNVLCIALALMFLTVHAVSCGVYASTTITYPVNITNTTPYPLTVTVTAANFSWNGYCSDQKGNYSHCMVATSASGTLSTSIAARAANSSSGTTGIIRMMTIQPVETWGVPSEGMTDYKNTPPELDISISIASANWANGDIYYVYSKKPVMYPSVQLKNPSFGVSGFPQLTVTGEISSSDSLSFNLTIAPTNN